jgi:hypothetical protein
MNSAELEIYKAVKQAQSGSTVIRSLCLICKDYLNDWDVQAHKALCWKCRRTYFPTPKVEAKDPEPKKATLFQLRDGKYAIIVD